MLKAEMHTHCSDDSHDSWIGYSAEELMEEAAKQSFDVLSITLHEKLYFPNHYKNKAEELGLCLIPGVELRLEGKDVLAYNITEDEAKSLKKIADLEEVRRKDTLIVAPHPYLPFINSLHGSLDKYHELFDAVEQTWFYLPFFKFWNTKARRAAEKHGLPLVANSDVHWLRNLGHSYTLIDADKSPESVISAVKKGNVRIMSRPPSLINFVATALRSF